MLILSNAILYGDARCCCPGPGSGIALYDAPLTKEADAWRMDNNCRMQRSRESSLDTVLAVLILSAVITVYVWDKGSARISQDCKRLAVADIFHNITAVEEYLALYAGQADDSIPGTNCMQIRAHVCGGTDRSMFMLQDPIRSNTHQSAELCLPKNMSGVRTQYSYTLYIIQQFMA